MFFACHSRHIQLSSKYSFVSFCIELDGRQCFSCFFYFLKGCFDYEQGGCDCCFSPIDSNGHWSIRPLTHSTKSLSIRPLPIVTARTSMNIDKVTEFNVQSSTNDDNQNSFISLLNHHKDVGVVKSTLVVVKSANGHIDRLPRKIPVLCVWC